MRSAWISGAEGDLRRQGIKRAEEALPHPRTVLCLHRSFAAIVADHHAIACSVAGALLFG
jgi:hypothetical protein